MPKKRFTAKWVKSQRPPAEGQVDYFDTNRLGDNRNFGLRISYGGRKTWFVMYRHNGKLRRLKIGVYPDMGLADARETADEQVKAIIDGKDPAAERQARKRAGTFGKMAEGYLDAKKHKKSRGQDAQLLNRDLLPVWSERKANEIRRTDVRDLMKTIVDRGAPIMANRVLQLARGIYNWALHHDDPHDPAYFLEYNPCAGVSPEPEHRRERVLTEEEIRNFWQGADELTERIRIALKLMLVTAQRKGEVVGARKEEFDLETGWWTSRKAGRCT